MSKLLPQLHAVSLLILMLPFICTTLIVALVSPSSGDLYGMSITI